MFGLSLGEVLILGVIALIVIGPKQLPEVARNIGRFLNDLKRATEGFTDDIKQQVKMDFDLKPRLKDPPPAAPEAPPSDKKDEPPA